jgi:glycosyltransferase involved in cell wall biosynthesis
VVHVCECSGGGGVATYLGMVSTHWPESGDKRRLAFILGEEGALADDLRARGDEVHIVPMPRTGLRIAELRAAWRLRRLLGKIDPSVVHLHSSQAGFIGRLACVGPRWRGRLAYSPHAFYYLGRSGVRRAIFKAAEKVLHALAPSLIIANSPSEYTRVVDDLGIGEEAATWLFNPVDTTDLPMPQRRSAPDGRRHVALVGRVSHQKNIGLFLAAAAALSSAGAAVRCHLAGAGHYADDDSELARLLTEHGLSEQDVEIHPWMPRADLLRWMTTMDAVALTSRYESFGYALAEASAMGIPVIGTRVDGIRDVVDPGVTGLLVDPDSAEELADAILNVVDDDRLAMSSFENGPQWVADRFSPKGFISGLSDAYALVSR